MINYLINSITEKNNWEEVLEESQRAAPSSPSPLGPWPRVESLREEQHSGGGEGLSARCPGQVPSDLLSPTKLQVGSQASTFTQDTEVQSE